MKSIIILILSIFTLSCSSGIKRSIKNDSSNCDEKIILQYSNSNYNEVNENNSKDSVEQKIFVMMEGGFSDTLSVYFNDNLISHSFFITDDILGTTGAGVEYNYTDENCPPFLRIISSTNNYCLELQLDSRYRILYLHKNKKGWTGIYSNSYHSYE
ncbi:MAG: hypothetical protein CVV25_11385 [Ignavibacteriae bacterium HGW-Ignavibacteriae-4]|jgi:hypothetical protein|nr:MAG: hypothetical protein CVV25_11385 [Ignavibacteriae bacterium HGW-Ignavibacteriae-4]